MCRCCSCFHRIYRLVIFAAGTCLASHRNLENTIPKGTACHWPHEQAQLCRGHEHTAGGTTAQREGLGGVSKPSPRVGNETKLCLQLAFSWPFGCEVDVCAPKASSMLYMPKRGNPCACPYYLLQHEALTVVFIQEQISLPFFMAYIQR